MDMLYSEMDMLYSEMDMQLQGNRIDIKVE